MEEEKGQEKPRIDSDCPWPIFEGLAIEAKDDSCLDKCNYCDKLKYLCNCEFINREL